MEARVQYLSQTGSPSGIPSRYIQPPELRPKPIPVSTTTTIPIIDLSSHGSFSSHDSIVAEIGRACKEWGFFQVVNHGVPVKLLDDARAVTLGFFEGCDRAEKMKYARDESVPGSEGYGSQVLSRDLEQYTMDWRDYFYHDTFPLSRRDISRWPDFPPNYRQVMEEYSGEIKALAQRVFALASEALNARPSCIEDAIGELYQNVLSSYYPPSPQPELTLGVKAHADFGAMTLLIQDDVGGLEVLKDGEWVPVKPISDAIVVNLADQTEVVTNGAYKSAIHRVVNSADKTRVSVVTFHDPPSTRMVSPSPELVSESSPARYRGVVYGDYVKTWYKLGPDGKRNVDLLKVL